MENMRIFVRENISTILQANRFERRMCLGKLSKQRFAKIRKYFGARLKASILNPHLRGLKKHYQYAAQFKVECTCVTPLSAV